MDTPETGFGAVLDAYRDEIGRLRRLGVTLVGSFPEGGALLDASLSAVNASALEGPGLKFLRQALKSGIVASTGAGCLVDVSAAAAAWEALGRPEDADSLAQALRRGRVCLMGTDGVRGHVRLSSEGDPVLHFGRTGEVTPELIEILCYCLARLARRAGIVRKGAAVAAAEDGRDAATGWRLSAAMKAGFQAAGLEVVYLGVAPTPAVPFAQARRGIRLGASLTASHNPASQNGIKFFVDGFKMLPEGPMGDFALSALAYDVADGGIRQREEGSLRDAPELVGEFADFIALSLPEGASEQLAGAQIVFDGANGSSVEVGRRVFENMGLDVTTVNDEPRGENINQGGGVAEIEGSRRIGADEAAGSPALASLARMMERADDLGETVYGVVMDGDGDRGFVVVCEPGSGEALVVDGDAEGCIIARHMRERGEAVAGEAGDYEFVGTVESDLQLFAHVEREIGFSTRIECVGDKWLVQGWREGRRLALGQEVSGHVLWPVETAGPEGEAAMVLTGNGLLTALRALLAARELGLSPAEMAEPFTPGTFITMYTYNVDKALFFAGSRAWQADVKAATAVLQRAAGRGFASWRLLERAEEPDMLYVRLDDESGSPLGAVFARNSGTENKTGIYARGVKSLEPVLREVCQAMAKLHGWILKDKTSLAYMVEMAVRALIEERPMDESAVVERIGEMLDEHVSGGEVEAVLFGMRKEGLIEFTGGKIAPRV